VAQNFYYPNGNSLDEAGMGSGQFSSTLKFLKNQAGDPITFSWELLSIDTNLIGSGASVNFGVCDNLSCYASLVGKQFDMTPVSGTSQYGTFKIQAFAIAGDAKIIVRLRVWDKANPSVSDTIVISWRTDNWVGIEEYAASAKMSVFPNPASDVLNVSYDVNELTNTKFELVSVLGNTVFQKELNSKSGTINLNISKLPRGIYFYSIKGANGKSILTKKLVIQ
jgi:hypothetical protein